MKSLRSLQTFWQIRFCSSNPTDYRPTNLLTERASLCCTVSLHWSFLVASTSLEYVSQVAERQDWVVVKVKLHLHSLLGYRNTLTRNTTSTVRIIVVMDAF